MISCILSPFKTSLWVALIFSWYILTDTRSEYSYSANSFLFSFVNKDNLSPFKMKIRNNQPYYAIYGSSSHGPTFGDHDIYIGNYANGNTDSYTNLGEAYFLPRGYSFGSTRTRTLLAGSYRFTPSDVEVLYKTGCLQP